MNDYKIGDMCYTIIEINKFYPEKNQNIYKKYSIREHKIEGFIIDEYGTHIAESNWDGWHNLTAYESSSNFDKVYKSIEEAQKDIDKYLEKREGSRK